jgi:hypothetical protein
VPHRSSGCEMLWSGSRPQLFPFADLSVGMEFQCRECVPTSFAFIEKAIHRAYPATSMVVSACYEGGCMRSRASWLALRFARNSSATRTRAQFLESPISSPAAHLLGCLCFKFCVVFDRPLARDDCASRLNVGLEPRAGSVGHAGAALWVGMKLDCRNKLAAFIAIAVYHACPAYHYAP